MLVLDKWGNLWLHLLSVVNVEGVFWLVLNTKESFCRSQALILCFLSLYMTDLELMLMMKKNIRYQRALRGRTFYIDEGCLLCENFHRKCLLWSDSS